MGSRYPTIGACLALLLLCGCDRGLSPLQARPLRPGADRQVPATASLPGAPPPAGYGAAVVPDEVGHTAQIGSVVPSEGGQQAQKKKEEKAIAGIKEQWERERAGNAPETSGAALPAPAGAPAVQ